QCFGFSKSIAFRSQDVNFSCVSKVNPEGGLCDSANAGVFATTHWSVVLAAGESESPSAAAALEQLCRTYWYPLYVFVRGQGRSAHDAQDLTQEFYARLLEKNYVRLADAGR